ncbi:MAG: GNAT family N-acetyltransferase [Candidatus Cloacimonetes bacterium]|nr:GNAT family N-acetyltransferase [Candidatus Cloacimonadota bacterium]
MSPKLKFQSDRLIIRPAHRTDYQEWRRAYLAELPKQSSFDPSPSQGDCITYSEFLAQLKRSKHLVKMGLTFNFLAFKKSTQQIIGDSQLWCVQRGDCQRATLGFSVINNHWRLGYGFEIAHATICFAIKEMGLNRIEAEIRPDNTPSIKLCEKLGMQSEGIRRHALYEDNQWQDHLVYSITAQDLGITGLKPCSEKGII